MSKKVESGKKVVLAEGIWRESLLPNGRQVVYKNDVVIGVYLPGQHLNLATLNKLSELGSGRSNEEVKAETKKKKTEYSPFDLTYAPDRRQDFAWMYWKVLEPKEYGEDEGMSRLIFAYVLEDCDDDIFSKHRTVGIVGQAKSREEAKELCEGQNSLLSKFFDVSLIIENFLEEHMSFFYPDGFGEEPLTQIQKKARKHMRLATANLRALKKEIDEGMKIQKKEEEKEIW